MFGARFGGMQGKSGSFIPVFDGRGRRVKGVFTRRGVYYGQVWVAGKGAPRRFRLELDGVPVAGVGEAREALERLRVQRSDGALPVAGKGRVTLGVWVAEYLGSGLFMGKKPQTRRSESAALERWLAFFGAGLRLGEITGVLARRYVDARLGGRLPWRGGVLPACEARTCNLDLTALRQCLKAAVASGQLAQVPEGLGNVRTRAAAPKRLLTRAELDRLLAAVPQVLKRRGRLVGLYLRFLAFTGCREQEALQVRWSAVNEKERQILIGESRGQTKNSGSRWIDWNSDLASLLSELREESGSVSVWLFPSWKRTGEDRPMSTLRRSLWTLREVAGLPWLGFHHLRHFFISQAVMSGIDFKTIAEWVGHRDGGVLIGKVYAHLRNEHRRRAAEKLSFL